jgi:flagellar M-ring protein FliF
VGSALSRVSGFWTGLTGPAKRLLVGAVVIFVVGLFLLMRFTGHTSYSTLATGAGASDAAAITSQLTELGIPYKLTDGGSTVQVPSADLDQARLDLAASNVLDGGNGVGFEIFDKSNLGATDFTNRVNLVRATEGELSRTIGRLDPVQSATVKIAMPDEQLFTDEQDPTTAAVVLTMRPGQELEAGQVKGVSKLVSMAVPGLKTADVTITDSHGNILEGADAEASGATAAAQRLDLESRYERGVQSRLDGMLAAVLGPGKAVTQVDAVLDLDKVTTDSETFDDESVVPLQSETSEETLESGAGGAGAAAGAAANTPPGNTFPATAGGAGGPTEYEKTTESTSNGVDRVRSQVEKTPGTVTSQAISVQVSDDVPADVVAGLEETVMAAVGFQEDRDQISVQAVPFAEDGTARSEAAAAASGDSGSSGGGMDPMGLAKTAAAAIGVLLLAFFARRSLKRRQSDLEKQLPELLKRGPVPVSELEAGATAQLRQLEGQKKSPVEQQMEDLARRKPDDVAQLLRGWLLEKR